jgi:hypothetical protein
MITTQGTEIPDQSVDEEEVDEVNFMHGTSRRWKPNRPEKTTHVLYDEQSGGVQADPPEGDHTDPQ